MDVLFLRVSELWGCTVIYLKMAVDAVVVVFAADVLANQFQLCECVSLHCVFDSRQTAHRSVHKCNDRVIVLFFISHKKDVTLIKKYFKMIF